MVWDSFYVAITCEDEQIQLIEWICQHGVHSSGVSSSTKSVNLAFVQMSFSKVTFIYSYGVEVESINIADSIDATLL